MYSLWRPDAVWAPTCQIYNIGVRARGSFRSIVVGNGGAGPVDLLSDILDTIELKGQLYFHTDFSPPWAVLVPEHKRTIRFHLVAQGRCWVKPDGGDGVHLEPGDVVLIPGGAAHMIADSPDREPVALDTVLADSGFSGSGALVWGKGSAPATTKLICGHFTFADGVDHPLLRALPSAVVVTRAHRAQNASLDELLRFITRQLPEGTLGSYASVRRLSEVVFIEAVRATAEQSPALAGIVSALSDPKIARGVEAMHRWPERAWTVETLAVEAGMSRSSFAEKFQALMGCGPLNYLSDWRMQRARAWLARTDMSISEIATKVGYQSPTAFARAFAQALGESPTAFRRRTV
jgi:AraC-like DNA-binding protein